MGRWRCVCRNLCTDIAFPNPDGYVYFTDAEYMMDLLKQPQVFTVCDKCGALAFEREGNKLEYYTKTTSSYSWQPIQTLLDDPMAQPLLLWDGEINIYGANVDEYLLFRDLKPRCRSYCKIQECDDLQWITQDDTCGTPDGTYSKCEFFSPTQWFPCPKDPDNE